MPYLLPFRHAASTLRADSRTVHLLDTPMNGQTKKGFLLKPTRRTWLRACLGGAGVVIVTFAGYELHLDLATAIPLFMLLVIAQSLTGDFWAAAIVSLLSAGCLDFFFTQPLFSLYMSNPRNVIALAVFILTALVITRLVSREHREAQSAWLQKNRLDRLYKLSQQLLALQPDATMTETFLEPFRDLFSVTAICAFDAETAEIHSIGSSRHGLEAKTREAYIAGRDFSDPESNLYVRCLRLGSFPKMTGAIGFEGLRGPAEIIGSLAALAAALVEKGKAFRKATSSAAAAQAEAYRSVVLDALAHEFKTPLATILAAAGGIREAGGLRPEQEEMAETVESEAVRLGSLTSRLLRTARLDREEIKPKMEIADLASLAEQIADQYAERSPDRKILLQTPREPVKVLADPQMLRLAIGQLLENACKYSAPGSTVTVGIGRSAEFFAVRVANTGSSIPRGERKKIFERFYRGVDATRNSAGSGLGLYVARKIAMAHGGSLDLETESQPEIICFSLKIPAMREAVDHVLAAK